MSIEIVGIGNGYVAVLIVLPGVRVQYEFDSWAEALEALPNLDEVQQLTGERHEPVLVIERQAVLLHTS